MAALASTNTLDSIKMHDEKDRQDERNDATKGADMASDSCEHQASAVPALLAVPKSNDHLYRRRSMTYERNGGKGPAELTLANGKPRRSIPSEMQLGHASGRDSDVSHELSSGTTIGSIPLPLASPVTLTAASLTALSLSSGQHSEPPSPRTPTTGGFSNTTGLSSSAFSTPSSRPLSLISSVSVSTLSVPRSTFHPVMITTGSGAGSGGGGSASVHSVVPAAASKAPSSSAETGSSMAGSSIGSGTEADDKKSVTSPREQNSPRPYSMSSSEALLSHHHHQHPQRTTAGTTATTRPARRQTIQSEYRHSHGSGAAPKNGGGPRRARGHSRQMSSDAGVGGGALSDSETLGVTPPCSAQESAVVPQKPSLGTPYSNSSSNHHSGSATKSSVSAQLRVNLYSLVTRGYVPANTTVVFREHSATITSHGTLVPVIRHHQDEDNKDTSSSLTLYPWMQQEYETPSAWATAMVKGARTGKVAVNGWSAIKVPLQQDPSLVTMYGGQGIAEVSLDVLRKKFLADLAGNGDDLADHQVAASSSSSKSASGSLSKASARQMAKELAMDGRKRKRQVGKNGNSTAADANGLWILTSKLDTLADGQRNSNHHHHPREQGGRVRGGSTRRPYKRSMPESVVQDEDSMEAAGALFAMHDHYSSHRGGRESGYGYKGYSAHRSSGRGGGAVVAAGASGPRSRGVSHRRIELQSVTKYLQACEANRAAAKPVPSSSVRRVTPLTLTARRSRDVCIICKKACESSNNTTDNPSVSTIDADATPMDVCESEKRLTVPCNDTKACAKCSSHAHSDCILSLPTFIDHEEWICPRCIHCAVCERGLLERPPNKASHCDLKMTILNCSECQQGTHLECQLGLEPSLKAFVFAGSTCETLPESFEWKCTSCRVCVECNYSCKSGVLVAASAATVKSGRQQKQERTPSSPEPPVKSKLEDNDGKEEEDTQMADAEEGVAIASAIADRDASGVDDEKATDQKKQVLIDGWTNGYSLCPGCTRLFEMGNICPLCCRLYQEDDYDTPMVFCDGCSFWVHVACDSGLAGNDYEELGKDSKQYFCPSCNPTPMPSPALSSSSSSSSSAYLPPPPGNGRYGHSNTTATTTHLYSRAPQEWGRCTGMQHTRYGQQAHKRDDILDLIMAAKEISDSESRAQSPSSLMDVDGSAAAEAVAAATAASMDSSAEVQAAEALLTIFSGANTPVCSTPYASYPPSPYEPHFNNFGSGPPRQSSGYPPLLESSAMSSPYHQDASSTSKCADCPDGIACGHHHLYHQQQQQQVFASPRSSYSTHPSDDYFSGQHRASKRISYQHIGQELNRGTLFDSSPVTTSSSSQYYPHAVKVEGSDFEHHPYHYNQHHGYSAAYHHGYSSSASRAGSAVTTPTTPYGPVSSPGGGPYHSMANMYKPVVQPSGVHADVTMATTMDKEQAYNSRLGLTNETSNVTMNEPLLEEQQNPRAGNQETEYDRGDVCALCRTKWTPSSSAAEPTASEGMITLDSEDAVQQVQDKDVDGTGSRKCSSVPWRVHRECILWSTGISLDKTSDRFVNATSVVERSQTATCTSCGHPGASIRCKASTSNMGDRSYACAATFHYPCVTRAATLSTSASTHAVVVDEQERSILCRMHYREVSTLNDLRAAAAAALSSSGTSLNT